MFTTNTPRTVSIQSRCTDSSEQKENCYIDAVDGFHSVEVDKESQHLLIFITDWGRYMPLRLPQGYFASGDAFTHRTDNITKDVQNKVKIGFIGIRNWSGFFRNPK